MGEKDQRIVFKSVASADFQKGGRLGQFDAAEEDAIFVVLGK